MPGGLLDADLIDQRGGRRAGYQRQPCERGPFRRLDPRHRFELARIICLVIARIKHQCVALLYHQTSQIKRAVAVSAKKGVGAGRRQRCDFALDLCERSRRRQASKPLRAYRRLAGDESDILARPAIQTAQHFADRHPQRLQSGMDTRGVAAAEFVEITLRRAVGQIVAAFHDHRFFDNFLLPVGVAVAKINHVTALRERPHQRRRALVALLRHGLRQAADDEQQRGGAAQGSQGSQGRVKSHHDVL